MEYLITDALKDDAPQIFLLERECFADYFREKQISEMLAIDYCIFKVLKINNIVFGYLIIYLIENECEIIRICVSKNIRQKGYGTILLKKAEEELLQKKAEKIFLEVRESNFSAINLYKKMNFKILGKRNNYYKNPIEDAIIMSKALM